MGKTRIFQPQTTAKHKGTSPPTARQPIYQRYKARSHFRKNHGRRSRVRA